MKNKKGFTLVELLAVIVILGVLLLIAVPAVQNIIASSQRKSFESAAKLAIENVETMASTEKLTGGLFSGPSITGCYVELGEIDLERGNYGSTLSGYVLVGADGKGTLSYANDSFYTEGGTLERGITVNAQTDPLKEYTPPTEANVEKCTWWS